MFNGKKCRNTGYFKTYQPLKNMSKNNQSYEDVAVKYDQCTSRVRVCSEGYISNYTHTTG
jgi:hypothetical protein